MTLVRDKAFWNEYLEDRTGTYEFRCVRYSAVADALVDMGMSPEDSVCDVGAGREEFGKFLREQGWQGEYIPVDGSIDGTDLDLWVPERKFDWMVAIEVIEHLYFPPRLLDAMKAFSVNGFCLTTPNPETVDVLGMDRTHVSVIWPGDLAHAGLQVKRATLFASPAWRQKDDSLLAWLKT